MAPEHHRPARRDCAHDPSLDAPETTGARLSKRFAMAAEDIRHLQSLSHGTHSAGRHDFQAESIERARRITVRFWSRPGCSAPCLRGWHGQAVNWMMRTSAPLSKRWVANVCRKVCTVTCLLKRAAAQAERQAACRRLYEWTLIVTAGKQPSPPNK